MPSGGKVGILVGGGPAPGINGVIAAATIESIHGGKEVIGFRDGYRWLSLGDADHTTPMTEELVADLHLKGGSVLGTSRKNPTRSEDEMRNVLDVLSHHNIDSLISIGGDDTAFTASQVYERAGGKLRVAHAPKTIDNDLLLPNNAPTFGFETARHLGTLLMRNLAADAQTTSRWYIVVSMGRAAGHLALGIGKAGAATLTLIPEEFPNPKEFPDRRLTVDHLCNIIIGSIIKRKSQGAHYGVVVLAEGLIERIGKVGLKHDLGEEVASRYGPLDPDPHDHLRLGEFEFGRMVKDQLSERLQKMEVLTTFIDKDLGYELRCADPIPFDAEYTRDLGYGAIKFLRSEESTRYGAIITFDRGRMKPLPFVDAINPETGRLESRNVDITSESFECAVRYMTRLGRGDLNDSQKLGILARTAGLPPEEFRRRFAAAAALS